MAEEQQQQWKPETVEDFLARTDTDESQELTGERELQEGQAEEQSAEVGEQEPSSQSAEAAAEPSSQVEQPKPANNLESQKALNRLIKERKELDKSRKEIGDQQKELETQKQALAEMQKKIEAFEAEKLELARDPAGFFKRSGLQIPEEFEGQIKPDYGAQLEHIRSEHQKTQKQLEEERQAREQMAEQAKAMEQARKRQELVGLVNKQVLSNEKYDLLKREGEAVGDQIINFMIAYNEKTGQQLTIEKAADILEENLEKTIGKYLDSSKFKKVETPAGDPKKVVKQIPQSKAPQAGRGQELFTNDVTPSGNEPSSLDDLPIDQAVQVLQRRLMSGQV